MGSRSLEWKRVIHFAAEDEREPSVGPPGGGSTDDWRGGPQSQDEGRSGHARHRRQPRSPSLPARLRRSLPRRHGLHQRFPVCYCVLVMLVVFWFEILSLLIVVVNLWCCLCQLPCCCCELAMCVEFVTGDCWCVCDFGAAEFAKLQGCLFLHHWRWGKIRIKLVIYMFVDC